MGKIKNCLTSFQTLITSTTHLKKLQHWLKDQWQLPGVAKKERPKSLQRAEQRWVYAINSFLGQSLVLNSNTSGLQKRHNGFSRKCMSLRIPSVKVCTVKAKLTIQICYFSNAAFGFKDLRGFQKIEHL